MPLSLPPVALDLLNMKEKRPILYIKEGCPYCTEALTYFENHGVDLDIREVRNNKRYYDEMVEISGQTKSPTFVYEEFMVADFDVDEFIADLAQAPEIMKALGLGTGDKED